MAGWVGVTPRYNAEVVSVGPVDMYADEETQSYLRLRDGQPPPKTARVGDKEGEREREREGGREREREEKEREEREREESEREERKRRERERRERGEREKGRERER